MGKGGTVSKTVLGDERREEKFVLRLEAHDSRLLKEDLSKQSKLRITESVEVS